MAYKPTVIQPARCLRTRRRVKLQRLAAILIILRLVVVVSARIRVQVRRLAGVSLTIDQ